MVTSSDQDLYVTLEKFSYLWLFISPTFMSLYKPFLHIVVVYLWKIRGERYNGLYLLGVRLRVCRLDMISTH